jgi:hypothetical protein
VKASNSCARTLIFGSFLLLTFVKFFFLPLFRFFDLPFYCLFSFLFGFFYCPLISPSFHSCFISFFFAHMVSSLAYPNLLGNKRLGYCCCCCCCCCGNINIIMFHGEFGSLGQSNPTSQRANLVALSITSSSIWNAVTRVSCSHLLRKPFLYPESNCVPVQHGYVAQPVDTS